MRVSYNDYKLYLSILESVSKQLNKAIKSEASSKVTDEIPDHDFDGEANSSSVLDLVHIGSGPMCSKLGRYNFDVLSPFCGSQIKFELYFVNTYNFFAGVFILQFVYFLIIHRVGTPEIATVFGYMILISMEFHDFFCFLISLSFH